MNAVSYANSMNEPHTINAVCYLFLVMDGRIGRNMLTFGITCGLFVDAVEVRRGFYF